MKNVFKVLATVITSFTFAGDPWSIEMNWYNAWGESGPGIYANSDSELRLSNAYNPTETEYSCAGLKLSADYADKLMKIVMSIPQEIPSDSTLILGGLCDDNNEVSLLLRRGQTYNQFIYAKDSECRDKDRTPNWLIRLDTQLWKIFDEIRICENDS